GRHGGAGRWPRDGRPAPDQAALPRPQHAPLVARPARPSPPPRAGGARQQDRRRRRQAGARDSVTDQPPARPRRGRPVHHPPEAYRMTAAIPEPKTKDELLNEAARDYKAFHEAL